MKPRRDPAVLARVQTAFDLIEASEAIMRQNLRRRFPHEGEHEIQRRLNDWYLERPDAKHGDASGPFQVRRLFE
jgi:hypothetical protein